MRVLICGIDGYIGWSLALHLAKIGHEVYGIDNFSRRSNVAHMGSWSAIPILEIEDRIRACKEHLNLNIHFVRGDLRDYETLGKLLTDAKPESIVHLGEQPSAPFSMIDRQHALDTQENNVIGTLNLLFAIKEFCRDAHLIKLGTMGEYGTPNIDIPEGFFEVEFRNRRDFLPFPRQANSFYHWSKVHDSGNVMFACRIWNLRSTDIMQGVVYGTRIPEFVDDSLLTRFDFDEAFGTAINRFCAQSVIGFPLTLYGKGNQKRGFIALVDSVQCLTLAIENPPKPGEYRVFNQLDEVYNLYQLAEIVVNTQKKFGLKSEILPLANPRLEMEDHYYKVDNHHLRNLGFKPTHSLTQEIEIMFEDLLKYKERIEAKRKIISPTIDWRNGKVG